MNVSNPLARKVWPSHIHDDTRHMEIFFKHALFLSLRMFEYRQAKSAIYGSHQHTECPRRLVEGCSGCAKTYRTNRPAKCDFPARSVVGPCKPKDGISTFHDLTIPCLADHSIHPPASLPPWPLLWPAPQASLLLAPFFSVTAMHMRVILMAYGSKLQNAHISPQSLGIGFAESEHLITSSMLPSGNLT